MAKLFAHGEQVFKSKVRHLRRAVSDAPCYDADMKLRVREIREQRGITVEQLADLAGMSKSYLSEIERGKKTVNARRLELLARSLHCAPSDLLADDAVSLQIKDHLALLESLPDDIQREIFEFARFRARNAE